MTKYFKEITLLFVLLTIGVNGLAEALPINGISTTDVSDKYLTLFTPAGYVFAIWGVIYIGWLAYSVYPFLSKKNDWMKPAYPYFIVTAIANMTWLVLWHYEQLAASVVVMLILLSSLIMVYRQLEVGIYPVSAKTRWMVHIPISIYLGWISVATIANIASFLVQQNWDGFGIEPAAWTIVMLVIATLLGCIMIIRRKDLAFAAVLIWAFIGINNALAGSQSSISTVVVLAVVLLVIIAGYKMFDQKGRK